MPPMSLLLLVGGASMLVMGVIGGFLLVPKVVASQINKEKVLTPGSMSRGLFEKFPEPLYLKIYMWNVTNPMGVQKGEKPVLQEVGPFVYDEYKWKSKVKDRNQDDSVSFNPISWFYWNQTLSGSLTGNEVVTVPNILFLSIVLKVQMEMYPMLGMMNSAVMELFRKPTSVYMDVRVRDLLFDGVLINCTVKEFTTKTMCFQLKAENRKEVKEIGPNLYKFSFFGARNGTDGDPMRANRGSKEPNRVGEIMEFKEAKELKTWRGYPCNNITGSDGGAFPPNRTPKDLLHIFVSDLCRSIQLYFVREDVHREVPVYVYTTTLGDIAANESLHCFCRNKYVNSCPKKGSMDLTKCMGSPVIITLPHFYLATPEFLRQSVGCNPNPDLHGIKLELEPNTGTPLSVAIRLQFNIGIHNISKITIMKKLPRVMHPILWMEQGIVVPDQYVNIIKDQLLMALNMIDYGRWGMILLGLGMTVVGGALHSRQKRAVTPVEQLMSFAPNSPEGKTNPGFVMDNQPKKWKAKGKGIEPANIWVNDMNESDGDDPSYLSMLRARDRGLRGQQGSWGRPHQQRSDLQQYGNSDVIRDPELDSWERIRDPEMENWIRREVGGNRREPGMGSWEMGGGFGRTIPNNLSYGYSNAGVWAGRDGGDLGRNMNNLNINNNIRNSTNRGMENVGRNIDNNQMVGSDLGVSMNRQMGPTRDMINNNLNENSNVGNRLNRDFDSVGQNIRNSIMGRGGDIERINRERRERQIADPSLIADVDNWINRERQDEVWRDADDTGTEKLFQRRAPVDSRTATIARADDWQGRTWPNRRY